MKSNSQLHHLNCYGIIDCDYRSNYEIESFKKDNIFTLEVAEVENLFLIEGILEITNEIMGFTDKTRIEEIKKYIIEDRFEKEINRQICESVVAELKYQLSTVEISKKDENEAKQALNELYNSISYDSIKEDREKIYNDALESKDYDKVLRIFNCKSLSTSTGHFLELNNKSYRDFIIRQLNSERSNEIINAILPFLPSEIPINL